MSALKTLKLAAAALLVCASGAQAQTLNFVHVDHLNTPRLITNASQQAVWKWDQDEPFGDSVADENPSSLGTFEFDHRFPGQYFDKESNLAYNYFREYDPGLASYKQSDPIGLRGGVNTYAYVDMNPLVFSDWFGLQGLSRDRGRPNEVPGRDRPNPSGPAIVSQNSVANQALVRKYDCYISCRNSVRSQCNAFIGFCSAGVIVFAETGPIAVVGALSCVGTGLAVRAQGDGYCSSTCGFK
jgi:RHS repeat-associated protein